jgi:hypothetical protein
VFIKTLALHSLPYIASIATSIVAAQNIAPLVGTAFDFQSDSSAGSASFSGNVVNRSLKGDRLPVKLASPGADDKGSITAPTEMTPTQKLKSRCKPPMDVIGGCFADAGPYRYTVLRSS